VALTPPTEHPVTVTTVTESATQHWVVCERCGARWYGPTPTRTRALAVAQALNTNPAHRPAAPMLRRGICCTPPIVVADGQLPPADTGYLPAPVALVLGLAGWRSPVAFAKAVVALAVLVGVAVLIGGSAAGPAAGTLVPAVALGGVLGLLVLGATVVAQMRQRRIQAAADAFLGSSPAPRHRDPSGEHQSSATEMADLIGGDQS